MSKPNNEKTEFAFADFLAIFGGIIAAGGIVGFGATVVYHMLDRPELGSPEFRAKIDDRTAVWFWVVAAVGMFIFAIGRFLRPRRYYLKSEREIELETLEELKRLNRGNLQPRTEIKIYCKNCKTLNDADARFCKNCSKSLLNT